MEKQAAAQAAADLVDDGMAVGLGTGSTVAFLLPALAARRLGIRCVATSPRTERAAWDLGLTVEGCFGAERLDLAIDGADQIGPDGWLVKGGGGAHTRERIVASTAERFVVIADSSKVVPALEPPIPLELLGYGTASTVRRLSDAGLGPVRRRDAPPTPDGGALWDYWGEIGDPRQLGAALRSVPGVVDHGLFAPEMVSLVLVGRGDGVERLPIR